MTTFFGVESYSEIVVSSANFSLILTICFAGSNDYFFNEVVEKNSKGVVQSHVFDRLLLSILYLSAILLINSNWAIGLFILVQAWVNWLGVYFRAVHESKRENALILKSNLIKTLMLGVIWVGQSNSIALFFVALSLCDVALFFSYARNISIKTYRIKEILGFQKRKLAFVYISFVSNLTVHANMVVIGGLNFTAHSIALWSYIEQFLKVNTMVFSSLGSLKLRSKLSDKARDKKSQLLVLLFLVFSAIVLGLTVYYFQLEIWLLISISFLLASYITNVFLYPNAYSLKRFKPMYVLYVGSLVISGLFYVYGKQCSTFYLIVQGLYMAVISMLLAISNRSSKGVSN